MSFTITVAWWSIPAAITVLSMAWAFFWPVDDGGILGGLNRVIMLIPALLICVIAWFIAALVK